MRYDLEKMIFEDLRQRLQPKRFNHVCGVVETSEEYLCKLHGGEIKKQDWRQYCMISKRIFERGTSCF